MKAVVEVRARESAAEPRMGVHRTGFIRSPRGVPGARTVPLAGRERWGDGSMPRREEAPLSRADLLAHPVRLRIIMALAGEQLTPQQIAAVLADVPPATLYRQINRLAEGGV